MFGSKTLQPANHRSKRRVLSSDPEVGIDLADSEIATSYGFNERHALIVPHLTETPSQRSSTAEGREGNIMSSQSMTDSMSSAKMSAFFFCFCLSFRRG